ncbi:MAG: antibiotic biosynthesis monooxygenase family protein [Acidiferrobacterales bacterium]
MAIAAITRMMFGADAKDDVLSFSREAAKLFPRQKGFRGIKTYLSDDGDELVSVIEWETRADHEACQQSPDFGPVLPGWIILLESGRVKFEVKVFAPFD